MNISRFMELRIETIIRPLNRIKRQSDSDGRFAGFEDFHLNCPQYITGAPPREYCPVFMRQVALRTK
jgi:hypothetical protein